MKKLGIFLLSLLLFAGSFAPAFGATVGPRETLPVDDGTAIVKDGANELRFEVGDFTVSRVATLLDRSITLGMVGKGSAVPTTGLTDGLLWWHTPTGRTILLAYLGGTWYPLTSLGTIDVYTDKTDGTDSIDKGSSVDSGAFKSFQYAWDIIPPDYNGDVTLHINDETYTETLIGRGKQATGDYNITVVGTLPTADDTGTATSATAYVMGAAGSGATQATLVDTSKAWGVNAYQNWLLIITGGTGAGQERVLDSNTATVLTPVGVWDTIPDATSTYSIYDLSTGTTLDHASLSASENIIEFTGQKNVILKYINFENWHGIYGVLIRDFASVSLYSCRFERSRTDTTGNAGVRIEGYSILPHLESTLFHETGGTKWNRGIEYQTGMSPIQGANIRNIKMIGILQGVVVTVLSFQNFQGDGWVLDNQRQIGLFATSFSRVDIQNCIIKGAGTNNIKLLNWAYIIMRSGNEIDGAGGDNILSESWSQAQNSGGGNNQVNNAGGWGVNTTVMSRGKAVSTISYTGNTSGTYIADATSQNN